MPKRPLPAPGEIGNCYLIHLDKPIAHARHYIGWELRDDDRRITAHRNGNGGRLLAVANSRGISYQKVRTWPGTSKRWERQLKNYAKARMLCPVCNEDDWDRLMADPETPRQLRKPPASQKNKTTRNRRKQS